MKTYPLSLGMEFWHTAVSMFLRATNRKKDGKDQRYFSIVENRRVPGGKMVQRRARCIWARSMTSSKQPGARRWRYSMSRNNATQR